MESKRAAKKKAPSRKVSPARRATEAPARLDRVREVTNIQAFWQDEGSASSFELKLVLDNGVEEYALRPDAQEMNVLLGLFRNSGHVTFDTGAKLLKFTDVATK